MVERGSGHDNLRARRARRWAKEIILAAVLTIAAAIFIAVTFFRTESTPSDSSPLATARKSPSN